MSILPDPEILAVHEFAQFLAQAALYAAVAEHPNEASSALFMASLAAGAFEIGSDEAKAMATLISFVQAKAEVKP